MESYHLCKRHRFAQAKLSLFMLALLLVAALPSQASPSQPPVDAGWELINSAINLIQQHSYNEYSSQSLANGGINGMRRYFAQSKQNCEFLKDIPGSADNQQALSSLQAQYKEAAKRYPQALEKHELTFAAVSGVVKALNDPYSFFLTPAENKSMNEELTGGNFGGIGVLFRSIDPKPVIAIIYDNTPAKAAGLKEGDLIVAVDGKDVKDLNIYKINELLRGEEKSQVKVTYQRGSAPAAEVVITREKIHVPSIVEKLLESQNHKIGYMKIEFFSESTNLEMERVIRHLDALGAECYIIDVRGNEGGYINAAIDVCSKFLPTGSLIVTTVDKKSPNVPFYSHPNLRYSVNPTPKPLVVLMDGESASSSEITASALREGHERCLLVGDVTFGKGSVQRMFELNDIDQACGLKITVSHYRTPSGHDLDGEGLAPDIKVIPTTEQAAAEQDVQLEKAIEAVIRELLHPRAPEKRSN